MRILATLWILAVALLAKEATVIRYEVDLSLFGKVGEATISIAEDGERYVMVVEDHATGMAAKISGNERDLFISRGHIFEGRYISDVFIERQKNDTTSEVNTFTFDHEAEKVTRHQDKNETVTESTFDISTMGIRTVTKKKRKNETAELDFYSEYDALSVVLNIPRLVRLAPKVAIKPVGLAKKGRRMLLSEVTMNREEIRDDFDSPNVVRVVQLDSIEDDDEYGVYIGYNAEGGIEEVVTKETYFLIGYGRIVKIDEKRVPAEAIFERYGK
jgi:glutamate synthase domain-containing protein 2